MHRFAQTAGGHGIVLVYVAIVATVTLGLLLLALLTDRM